jgi:hypothetical protein
MTYQDEIDAQKNKNAIIRIAWRQGWIDCGNDQEPNPDNCESKEPGYIDGYFAGYGARARIAKYNK